MKHNYKKLSFNIIKDLRDDLGGIELTQPYHGMSDAELYEELFPIQGFGFLNRLNMLKVAEHLSTNYGMTVGISNWTIHQRLNKQELGTLGLIATGSKKSIDELCEEELSAEKLDFNGHGFKPVEKVSKWSPYYRGVTLQPTNMWGLLQMPIQVEMYRKDFLRKQK